MTTAMRRLLHLALILCLMLTGIGLGAARGTVVLDGRVAICTGEGIILVEDPAGPRHAQVCPDMALAFLAAPPVADIAVPAPGIAAAAALPHPAARRDSLGTPRPAARGPPVSQFSSMKPA